MLSIPLPWQRRGRRLNPTILLPEAVLIEAVRVVVRAAAVMHGDPAPRREELADGGADVARELDAFPHVADRGLALAGQYDHQRSRSMLGQGSRDERAG